MVFEENTTDSLCDLRRDLVHVDMDVGFIVASCFFMVIFVSCQAVDFIKLRILAVFCAAACCRRFSPAKQMGLHMDSNRS